MEMISSTAQTLIQLVSARTKLRPSGPNLLRGLCPFHEERTPSFCVYTDTATWHCYGCRKHGDLIQWLREVEGQDFWSAKNVVVDVGYQPGPTTTPRDPEPPGPDWQRRAASLITFAQAQLWASDGEPARAWLTGPRRHLTEQTIRNAGLGWIPRPYRDDPRRWGLMPSRDDDRLAIPCGIVIPIILADRVWGIKIRPFDPATGEPDEMKPKYVFVRASVPALLGCDEVQPGDTVICTEGEFDRYAVEQEITGQPRGGFGRVSTVTMGAATHRLSPFWLWKLAGARRILSIHDNDAAGRAAAKAYESINRITCVFPPEPAHDPTEMVPGGRLREWLAELIAEAP